MKNDGVAEKAKSERWTALRRGLYKKAEGMSVMGRSVFRRSFAAFSERTKLVIWE